MKCLAWTKRITYHSDRLFLDHTARRWGQYRALGAIGGHSRFAPCFHSRGGKLIIRWSRCSASESKNRALSHTRDQFRVVISCCEIKQSEPWVLALIGWGSYDTAERSAQ
ncbi:unnamed protein product [Mycena citricolor]|uniref:Uncharacterized protein n=1 Tax=Mycena citricolor TaxID=2018698 RepID=A0AAD2K4A5_9AGAR|nr:unnamed protein product [Mycena citricolor]